MQKIPFFYKVVRYKVFCSADIWPRQRAGSNIRCQRKQPRRTWFTVWRFCWFGK